MEERKQIDEYCRQFKTAGISTCFDQIITEAEANGSDFVEFTLNLLGAEADHRHHNDIKRKRKLADCHARTIWTSMTTLLRTACRKHV